jgi:hypothetical protein
LNVSTATLDELWIHGRLVERRLSHGVAVEDERGIHATDARDPSLVAACDAAMEALHACIASDLRMRLVAEGSRAEGVTQTVVVAMGDRSVVTNPQHFNEDVALLSGAPASPPAGPAVSPGAAPLLWLHGTAAILLHEMVGHPLEHGQPAIALPPWLIVDVPLRQRRASFKDVPLMRMTDVIARQIDAPFAMPDERIEIVLVDGGAYDPLTQQVTLRIAAANLIEGGRVRALAPFAIHETRENLARSIIGATGETLRYPGVICSREGQELVVGSFAPILLTEHR